MHMVLTVVGALEAPNVVMAVGLRISSLVDSQRDLLVSAQPLLVDRIGIVVHGGHGGRRHGVGRAEQPFELARPTPCRAHSPFKLAPSCFPCRRRC
ncbi:hypothetical protein PR002_g31672 [Phytophthora rubi]|uniref:Uncharacterized protein n=1 Tax=Phytophthora rubi TaxID=129364 RepID=A0A6A3GG67_9STRA|nr:hypothetical protein PR002_g31672 [Phytophthora rubi]